jgi:hypothetical protein
VDFKLGHYLILPWLLGSKNEKCSLSSVSGAGAMSRPG